MVGTVLKKKVKALFCWSRKVLGLFCFTGTLDFVLIWSLLNFTGITLEGIARAVGRSQRWESSHPTQHLRVVVTGGARWNRDGCLPRCLEDCTRCLPPPCSSCPASPTSTSSVALRLYLDYTYSPPMILSMRANDIQLQGLGRKEMMGKLRLTIFGGLVTQIYMVLSTRPNDKPSLNHHQIWGKFDSSIFFVYLLLGNASVIRVVEG